MEDKNRRMMTITKSSYNLLTTKTAILSLPTLSTIINTKNTINPHQLSTVFQSSTTLNMMKHLLHLFIVLVLPLAAVSSTQLIQEACKETSHKELCIETLQSDPSTQKADLKGLLVIMLKAAHKKARQTCDKIPGLMEDEKDAFIEQCLNNCKEQYMDAVDQIEDSLQALDSSGYSDAKTWVTAAMGDVQACGEEFSSKSPLTEDNDVFVQLCRISLSILKLHVGSKSNRS